MLYIWLHDWFHPRIISRLGCFIYGIHPKEKFGFRYKFFRDNICKDDDVIDIACGTGTILGRISDKIRSGLGIDMSIGQIQLARKYCTAYNLQFYMYDIFDFDYDDEKYNVVIMSHILEHIKNPVEFLRKIHADKLLICVPSKEGWYSRLKIRLGLDVRTDAGHYREYTVGLLEDHVNDAGYRVDYVGFNGDGDIICRAFNEKG